MKIGELAQLCGVSQATIRYYIRTGLLIPNSTGAQYNFTERDLSALKLILKLKHQHFNLKESQEYLVLTRHSNFIEPDTIQACRQMFADKREEISAQILQFQQIISEIDQEMLKLSSRPQPSTHTMGVPLIAIPLLACPFCGRPLTVENALIQGEYVYSGDLCCPAPQNCPNGGYQAQIEHGIVKTRNLYTAPYDSPDLNRGLYRDMVPSFSSALQRCYDYICEELTQYHLHNKVILEANVNGYFFLYHHLNFLPDDCIYVVTDKFPEILEMYKSLIEQMPVKHKILFLADASEQLPLRPSSIDLHITFFGENEYQLYHHKLFVQAAKKFFKPEVRILGAYLSFDPFSRSRKNLGKKYPESSEDRYQVDCLRKNYEAAGYRISLTEAGYTLDSGTRQYSFECHVKGEPLRIYHFSAAFQANHSRHSQGQ